MAAEQARWQRRADVLWRRSLDSVVVLPVGVDEPITVSGSGVAVWDLLAEPRTVDELVDALLEVYDADRATVTADVTDLLATLSRFGVT